VIDSVRQQRSLEKIDAIFERGLIQNPIKNLADYQPIKPKVQVNKEIQKERAGFFLKMSR